MPYAVGIVIQLVEIFVYVVLAIDFFSNYRKNKAVRSASATSTRKSKKSKKLSSAAGTPPHHHDDKTVVNSPTASVNDHHVTSDNNALEKADFTRGEGHGEMTGKARWMSYGLAFSTLTLFIRAIYRTIELSNGWRGRVIHTQVYFSESQSLLVSSVMAGV